MPGVSSRVKVSSKAPDGAVGPVRGSSRMALWGVDGFFSFAELCRVSLVTRTPAKERVDPLYGKMKTLVGPTPEWEEQAMAETWRNRGCFDDTTLLGAGSEGGFATRDRSDAVGFFGCCAVSGAIIGGRVCRC
jgi:hypothetical protein